MGSELIIKCDTGKVSDGHHTFDELYEHRMLLFIALAEAYPELSWKSKLHADGTMYDGWFIAGMNLPTGNITYHIKLRLWDLLKVKEYDVAQPWDGHTSNDVELRLKKWIESERDGR